MNYDKIFSLVVRFVLWFFYFCVLSYVCGCIVEYFVDDFVDARFFSKPTAVLLLLNPLYMLNIGFLFNTELGQQFLSANLLRDDIYFNYAWFFYNEKYPFHLTLFGFFPNLQNVFDGFFDFNNPVFFYFGVFFFFTTVLSFFFFNYLGLYGVFSLNLVSLFFFWIALIFYFNSIMLHGTTYKIFVGKWFYLNINYLINFDFFIDKISFSFMFLTVSIALFVYVFAFAYFRYEPLVERLLLFLCLFVLSMVFLVTSGNLIMLFLGWELIGLTSFFLINFWVTRVATLKAAFKAFVFNKFSDVFLFFFILLVFNVFYDLDVITFNGQITKYSNHSVILFNYEVNIIEILSILLVSSAFIKSAQFGAHVWLPDSMEAPVPASALIHSATLVSAGIFLILRFHPLIEISTYCHYVVPVIGSLTAVYGGLVASFQSDIKRILAYSTISHCGFLMVISMMCSTEFTIFYLYVHGFFKATVFLSVGNVLRFSKNYQDFRRMGVFYKYLPFDCFISFLCLCNLAGLPFSLGFFMKHFFLSVFIQTNFFWLFIYLNLFFGAVCGLFYSYRLFFNVFFDVKKARKAVYLQTNNNKLDSNYYANTSLAGNLAIFLLFVVAYVTVIYFYIIITSPANIFSDYDNILENTTVVYKNINSLNKLYNSSFINWVVLFLIISIVFTVWRETETMSENYSVLGELFIFFFWFYFFYNIL